MDQQQLVRLQIPSVNTKIERFFDNDPHADIKIIYNESSSYSLNKSYLRLESDYFKQRMESTMGQLHIKADFRKEDFEKVLRCLYGFKFMIPKSQAVTFWSIAKFIKVEKLANLLKTVVLRNLKQYNFYSLLRLANEYSDDDIFQACMKLLDDCNYAILKEHREELYELPIDLFKCLIINHNKFKKEKRGNALSNIQINELIKGYSEHKEYGDKLYLELKRQLLSPTSLSAVEYQLLYHQDILNHTGINKLKTMSSFSSNIDVTTVLRNNPLSQTTNEFVMSSENFLNRKKIAQLVDENEKLKRMVNTFNSKMSESMLAKTEFDRSIEQLKRADEMRQSFLLTVQQRIAKLEADMSKKDEMLKKQEGTISELRNQLDKFRNIQNQSLNFSVSKPKEEENIMITSKVLPGNYFKDIMKPQPNSSKSLTNIDTHNHSKSESKDHKQLTKTPYKKSSSKYNSFLSPEEKKALQQPIHEQIEQPPEEIEGEDRLEFSQQPTTITKEMHSHLMEVLEIDSFKKTRLELVFKAANDRRNLPSFLNAVKNLGNLVFLIHIWEYNKIIGAFISSPIEGEGIISDANAYLFSVTNCRRFSCKHAKCIQIGNGNLVKFSRDLIIKDNCLDEESECQWPTMFQGDPSIKNPREWLAGHRLFQITNLEVYQLIEQQIEMVM